MIRNTVLAVGISAAAVGVFVGGYFSGRYLVTESRREIKIVSCQGRIGQDVLVGVTKKGDRVIKRVLHSLDDVMLQQRITGLLVRTCESGVEVRGLIIPDASGVSLSNRPSKTVLGVLSGLLAADSEPPILGITPASRMGLFTDGRIAVAESMREMLRR